MNYKVSQWVAVNPLTRLDFELTHLEQFKYSVLLRSDQPKLLNIILWKNRFRSLKFVVQRA